MAMGTPRPTRHYRPAARPMPAGFAAASALEQILGAIVRMERKMMEGMSAMVADAGEREERMTAGWLADAEEREKRLAVKLLATEGIVS